MIALPYGLQLISLWLIIMQGGEDQAPWCMWSGHLFTGIFSSAIAQVHCFDSSTALQYWFWRELVSSVLLRIWPVWFLRDLFSFLPHNFILTCHSWNNWPCTISNRRDEIPKAGGIISTASLDKKLCEEEGCWAKHCLKKAWKLWALGHLVWILLCWDKAGLCTNEGEGKMTGCCKEGKWS